MSEKKEKTLLGIRNLIKITAKDLFELRKKYPTNELLFSNLPTWTINEKYDKLINALYFLQFTGFDDDDDGNFFLFDLYPISPLLEMEIDNSGFDYFFENDSYFIRNSKWVDIFEKLGYYDFKEINPFYLDELKYLIVEIKYVTYSYDDVETYITIKEYLDENFNLKKL